MKNIANKRILKVEPYKPGRPIDEVKRELGLKRVIKLASNECPYGPSPAVLRAIAKEAKTLNRYPDSGCYYLRRELAKRLKLREDQLIFGNGSDELIVLAIKVFVEKGDEVVIAKPSFLIYDIAARMQGAKVRAVPLKGFSYDLEGMAKATSKKTKIVFIGNPDNPAGSYVTHKQLERFLKKIRKDILVFVDEAYFEFATVKDYPRSLQLLKKHSNIIVSRTFSKMYGLAGLRVGYAMASQQVIDILNRAREPFNVNSVGQAAALAVLKDTAYYKRIAKKMDVQRKYLYCELDKMDVSYVTTFTNFILLDVGQGTPIVRKLLLGGVIVRDMSHWGLNNYIRVTIGTPRENKIFIKTLRKILKIK